MGTNVKPSIATREPMATMEKRCNHSETNGTIAKHGDHQKTYGNDSETLSTIITHMGFIGKHVETMRKHVRPHETMEIIGEPKKNVQLIISKLASNMENERTSSGHP